MDKVCFKCGKIKSIDEFYKHPKMKDGHFNKCKECAKKDVHDKYNDNIKNPDFVDKERERGREKYIYGENLLDTKEKHRIFMDKIFEINNVDYKYVEFDL